MSRRPKNAPAPSQDDTAEDLLGGAEGIDLLAGTPKKTPRARAGANMKVSNSRPTRADAGSVPVRHDDVGDDEMLRGMHDALVANLDAHWLEPVVLGDKNTGKRPVGLWKDRKVHTPADFERLATMYRARKKRGKVLGLGMRTGKVFVVEGDAPSDPAQRKVFEAELLRLLSTDGKTLPKPTVISGGGGPHWYFVAPDDVVEPVQSCVLWETGAEHEEIRVIGWSNEHGSNIALPPTLHWSGNKYRPGGGYVLAAPRALLDAIEAKKAARVATQDDGASLLPEEIDMDALPRELRERIESAAESANRSDGIYAAVCALRERGTYSQGQALWLITESGLPFCSKAEKQGDAWARGEVARVWSKKDAAKAASIESDFGPPQDDPPPIVQPEPDPEPEQEEDEELALFRLPRLPDRALYGPLRRIVDVATANSEATRPGVAASALVHFAARFGKALGTDIGDDRRTLPLFLLLVGPTARGRKGTSSAFAELLFADLDELLKGGWGEDLFGDGGEVPRLNIRHSVASGQGLIELVRDEGMRMVRDKEMPVPGVEDKRLLLELPEFGTVFAASAMESSTLTMVLRNAFDGKVLDNPTRTNPLRATDVHLCVFGHVTMEEFKRRTVDRKGSTDVSNGLLNRFAVLYSSREKIVPQPKPVPEDVRAEIAAILARNVHTLFATRADHRSKRQLVLHRTTEADALWHNQYSRITQLRYDSEIVRLMMARREPLTLTIAALLAAMNGESAIGVEALRAALAWGDYIATTNTKVFATFEEREKAVLLRDRIAKIRQKLAEHGGAMTLRDLQRKLGGKSLKPPELREAIKAMIDAAPPELRAEGSMLRLLG
jgi:hypothetical protein